MSFRLFYFVDVLKSLYCRTGLILFCHLACLQSLSYFNDGNFNDIFKGPRAIILEPVEDPSYIVLFSLGTFVCFLEFSREAA